MDLSGIISVIGEMIICIIGVIGLFENYGIIKTRLEKESENIKRGVGITLFFAMIITVPVGLILISYNAIFDLISIVIAGVALFISNKSKTQDNRELILNIVCFIGLMAFSYIFGVFLRLSRLPVLIEVNDSADFILSDELIKILIFFVFNVLIARLILTKFNILNAHVYIYKDGTALGIIKGRIDDYILYECIKTNKKDNIIKNKLLPMSELTKSNYYLSKKISEKKQKKDIN